MVSKAIDQLRTFLDHLDGEDRHHQLEFFRGVLAAGPEAVQELDGRLPGSRAPKALRQLSMEACFYYPWPEWVPILSRILRYEADREIFTTGARALGRIGSDEALEALRELNMMRQGAEFKELVAGVLAETDPGQAFDHYLSRLLEGSANTSAANEAAQRLATLVGGEHLEALRTVIMHPDLLVYRHAIQLLANIQTAEAGDALADIFEDSHHEVLVDRQLKEVVAQFRALASPAAREKAQESIQAETAGEALDLPPLVKDLFRDVVAATEEGKPTQLAAVLAQATEAMHHRARRLGFAVDATAEGMVAMVHKGVMDATRVLELLVEGYREQTGREGLARALARLVPADAERIHALILAGPDGGQRAAAVEILGARQEEALQPVLLKACKDPLADIADRALLHLSKLPSAEALARTLVQSPDLQDLALGLRLVAMRKFQGLVPVLLELVKDNAREETTVQVIATLGAVGGPEAVGHLLEMLHSGQSLRIQTLVAESLLGLGDPDVALALCSKADTIKAAALHAIAVESLCRAHGSPECPMPPGNGPLLLHQVRKAWMERNPWGLRLRVILALQGLHLSHPEIWGDLANLVRDTLAEKRPAGTWSPDALHQVQAAAKEFMQRASGLEAPPEG
jgi:HEAT repeat protein